MTNPSYIAPRGKFRVIAVDTFTDKEGTAGDFAELPDAMDHAMANSTNTIAMHIYDDAGAWCASVGGPEGSGRAPSNST